MLSPMARRPLGPEQKPWLLQMRMPPTYRLYVTARTLLFGVALAVTVAGGVTYFHDAAALAELRACMAKPRDKSEGETVVVEPPAVAVIHAPMIGGMPYRSTDSAADAEMELLSRAYDCQANVSGRTIYSGRAWHSAGFDSGERWSISAGFQPGEKWSTPVLRDWLPGLLVWVPLVTLVGVHRWFGLLTRPC
jgi:hypothetical protein